MNEDQDPRWLVSKIKAQWRREGRPNAEQCLAHYPLIASRKSLALELAYEEFCLREERGDSIDVPDFCGRFRSIRHNLLRQIEVHRYFEQNPELLATESRVHWPGPGETAFGFHVLQELGRGALARVYLCSQPDVGNRQVVCKIAHQGAYEAETLGRLKHPNIVPVHSVVQDEYSQASCICMPFCGRSTLCDVLDLGFAANKPPTGGGIILEAANQHREEQDRYDCIGVVDRRLQGSRYVDAVLHLGVQLADALAHAHEQWIIHRDLKPSNILITPDGIPMLLDFNLSRDSHQAASRSGGTLPYMSPEQIRGTVLDTSPDEIQIDEKADIYSLAAILYQLLSGQLPFGPSGEPVASRASARKLLASQRQEPRPLPGLNHAVDTALSDYIRRCLAFDPGARPASMREVTETLEQHLSALARAHRWVRLNRRSVLAGAIAVGMSSSAALVYAITREPLAIREYKRGLRLYDQRDFEAAGEAFSRAIESDPTSGEPYYWRGRTRLQRKEYPLAKDDFDRAAQRRDDGRDDACRAYCLNRLASGNKTNHIVAIMHYHNAIDKGFESGGLYNNLAYSWDQASPGNIVSAEVMTMYGETIRGEHDRLRVARRCLDRAISIGTNSPVVYFHRAWLELQEVCWRSMQPEAQDYVYVPDTGIEDIQRAIEEMAPNSELYSTAAQLFGYAARHDPNYAEPCLNYLRQAIEQGCDPSEFYGLPSFEPVEETDEFQTLLKRRPPKPKTPRIDLLIDPVDDAQVPPLN